MIPVDYPNLAAKVKKWNTKLSPAEMDALVSTDVIPNRAKGPVRNLFLPSSRKTPGSSPPLRAGSE
jgi:hypothetical protein